MCMYVKTWNGGRNLVCTMLYTWFLLATLSGLSDLLMRAVLRQARLQLMGHLKVTQRSEPSCKSCTIQLHAQLLKQ